MKKASLKILLCSDYFSTWNIGGATRVVHHQIQTLAKSQHSAVLLSGAPVVDDGTLPVPWIKRTYKSWNYLLGLALEIYKLRRQWQPDIVHLHQPLIGWLAHVILPKSVRRIYHFHSFWSEEKHSHARTPLQHLVSWFKGQLEMALLRRLNAFVVLSRYSEERLRTAGIQGEIWKIPGAVDLMAWPVAHFTSKVKMNHIHLKYNIEQYKHEAVQGKPLRLLSVRRLDPRMGLDLLLRAMALLVHKPYALSVNLCIVGTGREEQNLKQLCRELGLEPVVKFAGRVSEEELKQLMTSHDIMVIPTRELEGFGLSVIEAWAAGLPVCATSVGGLSEFSVHAPAIHLVGEPTVENLATGINYMVEQGLTSEHLAQHCRKVVEDHYSFESVGQALLALYEEATC